MLCVAAPIGAQGEEVAPTGNLIKPVEVRKFVLRPGDVLVNAPLGVVRAPAISIVTRPAYSPLLGIDRPRPPAAAQPRFQLSPALGVYRGAGVSGVSPGRLAIGAQGQLLEVRGVGLSGVQSASVVPSGGTTIASVVPAADGQSVALTIDVALEASPGLRLIQLRNAAGVAVAEMTPGAGAVVFSAELPVVESIVPSVVSRGRTYVLEIRGRNLRGLPFGQQARNNEQPLVRITPETGITIGAIVTSNDEGTLVMVPIEVLAQASLVDRVVQVVTASGESASQASPSNTLRLSSASLGTLTPYVSSLLGVLRESTTERPQLAFSPPLGVTRGPAITSLQPVFAAPGASVRLRLAGAGLERTTAIALSPANDIAIDNQSLDVSPTAVEVTIAVASNAALFPRRVTAISAATRVDAPDLLEIRSAPPQITALSPTYVIRDGSSQTIAVQGQNLAQTTGGLVVPDNGLVIESYQVIDDSLATLRMRAAAAAAPGSRIVRVSGPNGASTSSSGPNNTLNIIDAEQIRSPWLSPLVGVVRTGQSPPQLGIGYSPAIGVVRGPNAVSISPSRIERGRTVAMTVGGRQLAAVSSVTIDADEGISVQSISAAADGSSVTFAMVVAADAAPGLRRIALRAGETSIPFVPNTAAIVEIVENQIVAPIARPDAYDGVSNAELAVPANIGVLANDSDPDGGVLYAVLRRLPANGALNLRGDGGFSYVPDSDFVGLDRFEYSAGANTVVGSATSVTLTVAERNDAVDDSYATVDSGELVVPSIQGLLANDAIAPGAQVEVVLDSQPARGQLALSGNGGFTYRPDGSAGIERFRYRLVENGLRSRPAEVTITITAVNDPPVAEDDRYSVNRGSSLTIAAPGVLGNDTDPDNPRATLSVRSITQPAVGALVLNISGGLIYTPPPTYAGLVEFVYEVRDPGGLTDSATVTIDVNDGLAPQPDVYTFNEGEVLFVDTPGLLGNDSIVATGPVRIDLVQQPTPSLGTVNLGGDGSFVFTPSTPDTNGITTFQYRLRDNITQSSPASVRIIIASVNDPPVTGNDRWVSDENAELTVPAPGVLENDDDSDSHGLSAQLQLPPANGVVTLRADGSFNYVPAVNWRGTDSFTYAANDGQGGSASATVSIDVTQPPTATNDVYLVDVNTTLVVDDAMEGLLANDHDAPENDALSVVPNTPPRFGTLALQPDGTFVYTPAPGYVGLDTFQYQVTDGRSLSNVGTVTLAIGITSLPRAEPDAYEMIEDVEFVVPAAEGVLVNDTDADTPRDQLQVALVGYDFDRIQTIQVETNGSFRVRTSANFSGETFFAYQVFDGTDISNVAIVALTVNAVNDGVEANDDRFGVLRNTVLVTQWPNTIWRNDRWDPDYEIRYELAVPPQFGAAELAPTTGILRYTPAQDFAGSDTLTYRIVQVATGIADTALVTLRTNGSALANADAYTVPEDASTVVSPSLLANDSDPDGDQIQLVALVFGDGVGWVSVTSNDQINPTQTRVDAMRHFYGVRDIGYAVTDGIANTSGTIRVTVTPVPDDPRGAEDSYLTRQNVPLVVNSVAQGVLRNDFDPDTRPGPNSPVWAAAAGVDLEPLRAILLAPTTRGTLTFNENGTFTYVPEAGYSGTDNFRYRLVDGTGRNSGTTNVSIRVNSPAIAQDDAYVTQEDVLLSVAPDQGVLRNDSDPDGDSLAAIFAANDCAPCNGSVVLGSNGSFRYTPNRDFSGNDEFYYRASDGVDGSSLARVAITVLPVNDAPVTEPDTYRTPEDVVLIAPEAQGVLRNDREVDGEVLTNASLVVAPTHGTVLLGADGRFTYTPNVNFNGRDTFRYRVYDQSSLWAEDAVEVLVAAVNDAPVANIDAYETRRDTNLVVTAASGVLVNDTDVDGPQLVASIVGPPQHGALTLELDGAFIYVPNGVYVGVDRFQYQIDDGLGAVATANVTINVRDVPGTVMVTVEDDFYRFDAPEVTVAAPGVLGNDRVDGATGLSVSLVLQPDHGTISLSADGGFTYRASSGYSGIDGFSYAATAAGVSEIARVTLEVVSVDNLPPVAQGEQFGVVEDGIVDSRSVGTLLVNDDDPEGVTLAYVSVSEPSHGTLEVEPDGHFAYRPDADFHGTDQFSYRVSDGVLNSNLAIAGITVFAQNDAPTAVDDAYQGVRDQSLVLAANNGVLVNDRDVDGDPLLVALVDTPLHGQASVNPDGAFTYAPAPGWTGTDRFRYVASDGVERDLAEVTVRIVPPGNRPPVAVGEAWTIDEDARLRSADVGSLTANDSDPDGDPLIVVLVRGAEHGMLTIDGGDFEYRPDSDFSGGDSFTYRVSDGVLSSAEVTVQIIIRAVNDAPIVGNDVYSTPRTQFLTVPAAAGVLANDQDVEASPLFAAVAVVPGHGVLSLAPDGSFTYVPNGNFVGRDEFTYRASDGVASTEGRALIDVTAAGNRRPVAQGEQFVIAEDSVLDTRLIESLLTNDYDPDGQPLSLLLLEAPARGTIETFAGGHVRFVPQRDDTGEVTIPYTVSDGELQAMPVLLSIVLRPQPDPPRAQADLYRVAPGQVQFAVPGLTGVLSNDADPDGEVLTAHLVAAPAQGTLNLGLDGSFVYVSSVPTPTQVLFRYRADDASGAFDEAEVTLLWNAAPASDSIFRSSFEAPLP